MVPDAEWSGVRDGASGLEMLQECVFVFSGDSLRNP